MPHLFHNNGSENLKNLGKKTREIKLNPIPKKKKEYFP